VDIYKKNSKKKQKKKKKNSKKPRSDTWHAPRLTRVHFKKIKKIKKKLKVKKIKNKILKNHEVTRGSHCSWPLMI